MVGRIAEDQVAVGRFGGKSSANIMCRDFRPDRLDVICQTTTSHRLADVKRCPAAGHRIDDESIGLGVVVEGMSDDRGRNRTRMRNTESPIVPE